MGATRSGSSCAAHRRNTTASHSTRAHLSSIPEYCGVGVCRIARQFYSARDAKRLGWGWGFGTVRFCHRPNAINHDSQGKHIRAPPDKRERLEQLAVLAPFCLALALGFYACHLTHQCSISTTESVGNLRIQRGGLRLQADPSAEQWKVSWDPGTQCIRPIPTTLCSGWKYSTPRIIGPAAQCVCCSTGGTESGRERNVRRTSDENSGHKSILPGHTRRIASVTYRRSNFKSWR